MGSAGRTRGAGLRGAGGEGLTGVAGADRDYQYRVLK